MDPRKVKTVRSASSKLPAQQTKVQGSFEILEPKRKTSAEGPIESLNRNGMASKGEQTKLPNTASTWTQMQPSVTSSRQPRAAPKPQAETRSQAQVETLPPTHNEVLQQRQLEALHQKQLEAVVQRRIESESVPPRLPPSQTPSPPRSLYHEALGSPMQRPAGRRLSSPPVVASPGFRAVSPQYRLSGPSDQALRRSGDHRVSVPMTAQQFQQAAPVIYGWGGSGAGYSPRAMTPSSMQNGAPGSPGQRNWNLHSVNGMEVLW
eukprot:CAMPEP_0196732486 /NCGR_PEP_ID=MMETSP1091-20130531/11878_1 /TAXON_ID=302021 /ORGANISM="Rhodomonas sp., Strain CCMP768" /LENGTH=262 /DNA_ID=CAMNT_0042075767 /DNA_START=163 /DNA_END=951 /DNA_ORIENTATION=-